MKKFWILHRSNVQVWQSLSGKLVLHEACDQQKIDMSRCDLLARLKDHKWKTASLEESGVDYMLLHLLLFDKCLINSFLEKQLQSVMSYCDRCSIRRNST